MKIIINGKAFAKEHKTGVQRYCIEIVKELEKLLDNTVNSMQHMNNKQQVDSKKVEKYERNNLVIELLVPNYANIDGDKLKNIKIVKYGDMNPNMWEQIELPLYAKKQKCILINLCNTSPIIKPDIVCIHDINCVKNQKYYPIIFSLWYRLMFYNSIKRGKKIITVSKFSKEEIEKWYKIKNVEVVCNSFEHINSIQEDKSILSKFNLKSGEYYFTLGTVQKNKNIRWILEEAKNNPDKEFVITGYMNQKNFEFQLENVIYTGYLKDEELKVLMKCCKAYIMPSFYEGFGLPPLEAFALGKDVIASDIPVMHEIFENEVTYINPYEYNFNFEDIVVAKNREKILNKYSWKKSAEKLLEIILSTIEKE